MRIKLHQSMAGPKGSHEVGSIINLPDGEAQALVKLGQASPVSVLEKLVPEPPVIQTTPMLPEEVAEKPRGRGRWGKRASEPTETGDLAG